MLRDHFLTQININKTITPDIEQKITFKRVWSGKLIKAGDKVLYAYLKKDDNEYLFSLLESELEELDSMFKFYNMKDETIPILVRKR